MTLRKQNNNDAEMENETNEEMIRKLGKNGHLWEPGGVFFPLL